MLCSTAFEVVLSILILRIHHKDTTTQPPPRLLMKVLGIQQASTEASKNEASERVKPIQCYVVEWKSTNDFIAYRYEYIAYQYAVYTIVSGRKLPTLYDPFIETRTNIPTPFCQIYQLYPDLLNYLCFVCLFACLLAWLFDWLIWFDLLDWFDW